MTSTRTLLGFHVSISGSIDQAVDRAVLMGCTTFQMFTRNPRGWNYAPLRSDDMEAFTRKRKSAGFEKVVAHSAYLPNLAGSDRVMMKKSRAALSDELKRCEALEVDYLVSHIGSNMGFGVEVGIRNVMGACNEALEEETGRTILLIETMSGSKRSTGSRFEELRSILDGIKSERIGICIDSCHVFAAGYDISRQGGAEETMKRFDDVVGLERLKVIHLNDSKGELGRGLDRHEHLGMGKIGKSGLEEFLQSDGISRLPVIMETPIDDRRDDLGNLRVARSLLG